MEIKGSVVLITGAAQRVGHDVALYLAERGAQIAFSYYTPDEPWQETQIAIENLTHPNGSHSIDALPAWGGHGASSLAVQTEIRDAVQVKRLVVETVKKFGRIDVLINSASVWLKTPFLEISEEQWDLSLDVNLKGPFLASQMVAPHMLAQKNGVIINITDLSAFQVWPSYTHHAASKAGLVSLTKYMAVELAPHIRVNAIAPGTVLLPPNPSLEKIKWATENSVLKRVGSPLDVARLVEFLITNEFVTGSVYFVDGGRSLV
jgi:NAD(P)-dependent dehydrogenase (short-subunit alcohol dehydrogenase family)